MVADRETGDGLDAEVAQVREDYVGRPGIGHGIEQALRERANKTAHGQDTSGPDRRLHALGYEPAAAQRKERGAAKEQEDPGRDASKEPPEGRTGERPGKTVTGSATAGGKSTTKGG